MVTTDRNQVSLITLWRAIEVVTDVYRDFRPCCSGVWLGGGEWLGGKARAETTEQPIGIVNLRSWSSSTDRLRRKELLLG